jgi:hypothetical protein
MQCSQPQAHKCYRAVTWAESLISLGQILQADNLNARNMAFNYISRLNVKT